MFTSRQPLQQCTISNHVDTDLKTHLFTFVFINVLVDLNISGIQIVYNLSYSVTNNNVSNA